MKRAKFPVERWIVVNRRGKRNVYYEFTSYKAALKKRNDLAAKLGWVPWDAWSLIHLYSMNFLRGRE